MKKRYIVTIAAIIVIVICGSLFWNHHLEAKQVEQQVKAQHVANKSNYDNMWKSFKEMTQVTELQARQMKELYTDLITGRNQDQNLLFKMIQEDNPNMSAEVYTKLQNQISAGRKEFDNNQKTIADMIREYNTILIKYPIMTAITGKKQLDANNYIVTSERTSRAFDTGKDEEINLLGE